MENAKKNPDQPINLFGNIALTFSGGGYRASTFGLGVLSYFNEAQFKGHSLLENVKGISTVSGGTLTGATYAYYKAKGKDFDTFYSHFYNVLNEDKLLGIALEKLASNELWKTSYKKQSLINAFALAYAELLTDGTFKDILKDKNNKSHLEDICFNATDFSFGLAFRFQTTGDFGNYRLRNTNLTKLSGDMKLADAIASSSCFPTGFEPLVMPNDYVIDKKSDTYIALKEQNYFKEGIGIMDGGIVDNQGIGSIMNADARREKEGKAYDLIMVCDVGSYFMDPWEQSKIDMNEKGGALTPKKLFDKFVKKINSWWWIIVPLVVTIVLLVCGYLISNCTVLFILGGATLMFSALTITAKILIGKYKHKALKLWAWLMGMMPPFMRDKLKYFENLKLRLIQRMLEERGTSALTLISNIFMKQLRRLNYDLFYKNDSLKNRRITALIYELTKEQYKFGESDEKGKDEECEQIPDPGDGIYAAAKIASAMGTTLWFTQADKDIHRLKNLISCGQFTACFNLLKYCIDLKNLGAVVDTKLLEEMTTVFFNDWKKFVENPYWLFEQLVPEDK